MSRKPYRKQQLVHPRHYIREWRERMGLTQEQLAGRTDMSVPAISKIETGSRDYRQSTLEQFAQALGCNPADLLRPPPGHDREDELAAYVMKLDENKRKRALRLLRVALGDEDKVA